MATSSKPFLTPEAYLEQERKAESKSEYLNGETFAMSGASLLHNQIVSNCIYSLRRRLPSHCRVLPSDLRLQVSATGLFTYPDVTIVCGKPQLRTDGGNDTLLNPTVIFEVLSSSTEDYDLGKKFDHYRSLPSVQQYVTIAQEKVHIINRTRTADNQWLLTDYFDQQAILRLPSVGIEVAIADLYEQVF
jgi:Uma2 family endonuclease